jgi:chromosome partitioning protein
MVSIAWLSEKGGTGKTTSALNTAAGLARLGHRVLLVDVDPQANATLVVLQGAPAESSTLADVLLDRCGAGEAIRPTAMPNLWVLPSSVSLADANVLLTGEVGRENRLRRALRPVEHEYDYIVLDCSPQRSVLNINVMNYTSNLLVPVDPGLFSLSGLGQLQQAVIDVKRYLDNDRLRILGLVMTRVQRNNLCRDVERQLREMFGGLVFETTIPHSVKIDEAHGRFTSVLEYAPGTAGAKAYAQLVEEVIRRVREENRPGAAAVQPAAPDHSAA